MANKKRLISASKLAEQVMQITMHIVGLRNGKTLVKEALEKYRNSVMRAICEAPTVDAVEVVRRKDCKHRKRPLFAGNGIYCEEQRRHSKLDDFCSYGERREGE